jgi:hypothetical protein
MEMNETHGIIHAMEVPCEACQRTQNIINVNRRNRFRSSGQTGYIINQGKGKAIPLHAWTGP